jgi:hypothetical protein
MLRKGSHGNLRLQRTWNKYGEDSFSFNVVEQCEPARLLELEQKMIDSMPREKLMNLSLIAHCPESTPEIRQGRSERAKAQHAAGKLGRSTWKTDPKVVGAKIGAAVGRARKGIAPNFEWTEERRRRVAEATRKRMLGSKRKKKP